MATTTVNVFCSVCGGYGVIINNFTKDGSALHCENCDGTGSVERVIETFTERKNYDQIHRVFLTNLGITIQDYPDLPVEDQGGVSYEQWQSIGKDCFGKGTELEKRTCPKMWYSQINSTIEPPNYIDCVENKFRSCPKWRTRADCWTTFKAE